MQEGFSKPRIGLARKIARKLLKDADINNYPVLLKKIAKSVPELYIDGKELKDGISGLQATYRGVSFIRYNIKHSLKRNRFTVAHELGHLMLGHTVKPGRINLQSSDSKEIEANQFAAELLMPLQMLKKAISDFGTVDDLAKAFWVSCDAMSWRVIETGIYKSLNSWV